jgi:dTDP-4-dehydrorhamnose reductase
MILLFGGTGYVGRAYREYFQTHEISCLSPERSEVECADLQQVQNYVAQVRPKFIINASGYPGHPNVDATEDQPLKCLQDNVTAALNIAEAAASLNIPSGHVSSGCIYSGRRPDGKPWQEDDVPNFSFRVGDCSFYSGAKALAEEVLADYPKVYIWRLRLPFSHRDHPRNYLSKLIRFDRLIEVENSLSRIEDFVRLSYETMEKGLPATTYNLTNPGAITTSEVVRLIRESGVSRKEFSFFENEADFLTTVKVPRAHCVMEPDRALSAGLEIPDIHQSIADCLRGWQSQLSASQN